MTDGPPLHRSARVECCTTMTACASSNSTLVGGSQTACSGQTNLAELPALLSECYRLLGAVDELHCDGNHRLQLLGGVPHQQHLW